MKRRGVNIGLLLLFIIILLGINHLFLGTITGNVVSDETIETQEFIEGNIAEPTDEKDILAEPLGDITDLEPTTLPPPTREEFFAPTDTEEEPLQTVLVRGSIEDLTLTQPDFIEGKAVTNTARKMLEEQGACTYDLETDVKEATIGETIQISAHAHEETCEGRTITITMQEQDFLKKTTIGTPIPATFSRGEATTYIQLPQSLSEELYKGFEGAELEIIIEGTLETGETTETQIQVTEWKEEKTQQANSDHRLFLTLEGELIDGSIQVQSYSHSCAGPTDNTELYDTLQENMGTADAHIEAQHYDTATYDAYNYPLAWSPQFRLIPTTEETEEITEEELTRYVAHAFLEVESCPTSKEVTLTSTNGLETKTLPLTTTNNEDLFGPKPESGAACETIKAATNTAGEQLHVIINTDTTFDDYAYGKKAFWGLPLTDAEVRDILIKNVARPFTNKKPYTDSYDSINVYWLKTPKQIPCADYTPVGACTFAGFNRIYAEAIAACKLQGKKNVQNNILLGLDHTLSQYKLPPAGWTFLESTPQTITNMGIAIYFASLIGKPTPLITKEWKKVDLEYYSPYVLTHEVGHSHYGLDHTNYFSRKHIKRINHPKGLHWHGNNALSECERMTQDECEDRSGWVEVITRANEEASGEESYMTHTFRLPVIRHPITTYQDFGKHHVTNNIHKAIQKQWGLIPTRTCGDGILNPGEDVDLLQGTFSYDKEREGVGFCVNAHNEHQEVRDRHPTVRLEEQTNTQKNLGTASPPYDSGIVSVHTDTCRINAPCVDIKQISAGPLSTVWPLPFKGFEEGTPTDCSSIDYRYKEGEQTATFEGVFDTIPDKCEQLQTKRLPAFPQTSKNILVAYIATQEGRHSLRAGYLDSEGELYSPLETYSLGSSKPPLAIEYVDFKPQYLHDYEPLNDDQPFALVTVFEDQILIFPSQKEFVKGIDFIKGTGVAAPTPGIEQVIDISYHQASKAGKEGIYVTYLTKPSGGVQTIQQHVLEITNKQFGTWNAKTISTNSGSYSGSYTASADARTATAIQEKRSATNREIHLHQQTTGKTATRIISNKPLTETQVQTKPQATTDHFGRYTYTELLNGVSPTETTLRHSTITGEGLRTDTNIPLTGHKLTNTPTMQFTTLQDRTGTWHSVIPVTNPSFTGVLSVDSKTKQITTLPASSTDHDMDVFEKELHTKDHTNKLILLETEGTLALHMQIDNAPFEARTIDKGSTKTKPTDYSHLTIHATPAGPKDLFENTFVCENLQSGYLAGNNGKHGWPLLDIGPKGRVHLLQTNTWGPIGKPGVGAFDTVDGEYGNGDDIFLGWADVLSTTGGFIVDGSIVQAGDGTTENKAVVLVLADRKTPPYGKDLLAYEATIGSDTPTRLADTHINTNANNYAGEYYLSGKRLYIHTYTNDIYAVELYQDAEVPEDKPKKLTPNPSVSWKAVTGVWAKDGILAIATPQQPNPGTYIYWDEHSDRIPTVAETLSYDEDKREVEISHRVPEGIQTDIYSLHYGGAVRLKTSNTLKTNIEGKETITHYKNLQSPRRTDQAYTLIGSSTKNLRAQGTTKIRAGHCDITPGDKITKLQDNEKEKDYYHAYDQSTKKHRVFTIRLRK